MNFQEFGELEQPQYVLTSYILILEPKLKSQSEFIP
jgi:hypothetical protein